MKHLVCCIMMMVASLLCGGSLLAQNNESGVRVIVIDAGHGGAAFPGAVYGGVKEKDINLKVALKLGALIEKELPSIKVVYTRTTDKALGKTLNDDLTARADIANKAEGDFFISIHANAAKSSSVRGAETIIMGESEKETRYNESVLYDNNKEELIDMSDANTAAMVRAYIQNLQFTYGEYSEMMARIMQSHYAKGGRVNRRVHRQLLKVLYATDMPSVLTELGFMTNKQELAFMNSEKGQNHYARILCDAVKEYVGHINRLAGVVEDAPSAAADVVDVKLVEKEPEKSKEVVVEEEKAEEKPAVASPRKTFVATPQTADTDTETLIIVDEGYAIQLLASDKQVNVNDAQFKNYRGQVRCLMGSGTLKYKYCVGCYATRSEAQKQLSEVQRIFKGAFVVHYDGDKLIQ